MSSKIKTVSLALVDDFEIVVTGHYTPPAPDSDDTGPGTAAIFEISNIDGDVCSAMIFTSDYIGNHPDESIMDYLEDLVINKILKESK